MFFFGTTSAFFGTTYIDFVRLGLFLGSFVSRWQVLFANTRTSGWDLSLGFYRNYEKVCWIIPSYFPALDDIELMWRKTIKHAFSMFYQEMFYQEMFYQSMKHQRCFIL